VNVLRRSSFDEVGDLLRAFCWPARFSNGEELGMLGPIIDDPRDSLGTNMEPVWELIPDVSMKMEIDDLLSSGALAIHFLAIVNDIIFRV
jgi:hypothetical protein